MPTQMYTLYFISNYFCFMFPFPYAISSDFVADATMSSIGAIRIYSAANCTHPCLLLASFFWATKWQSPHDYMYTHRTVVNNILINFRIQFSDRMKCGWWNLLLPPPLPLLMLFKLMINKPKGGRREKKLSHLPFLSCDKQLREMLSQHTQFH